MSGAQLTNPGSHDLRQLFCIFRRLITGSSKVKLWHPFLSYLLKRFYGPTAGFLIDDVLRPTLDLMIDGLRGPHVANSDLLIGKIFRVFSRAIPNVKSNPVNPIFELYMGNSKT